MNGTAPVPAPVPILPEKVQGLVLRGYHLSFARHFVLSVNDAGAARTFLGNLVGDTAGWPQITSAAPWGAVRPDHCLNVGFTYPGLQALLGASNPSLDAFNSFHHLPFVNGSASSNNDVGDIGASDPGNWRVNDRNFHLMLSLFAKSFDILEQQAGVLTGQFGAAFVAGAPTFDSQALPDDYIYFGYHDGIAQPIIEGVQHFSRDPQGSQPLVDPGAFMLGTATGTFFQGVPVPDPPNFGNYGCFGAFRMLKQDEDGFANQVEALKSQMAQAPFNVTDADVQTLALKAKMCGRWPNGTPLARYPVNGNTPGPVINPQDLNDFNYVLPDGDPNQDPGDNPDAGTNVPLGCHIRRGNSREFPNADAPDNHRIMRRAMPYQVDYDPAKPLDRHHGERGLMGFFLSATLKEQFEFVQMNWLNNGNSGEGFATVEDPADPLMAATEPEYETVLTGPWPPLPPAPPAPPNLIQPMSSFVTTMGSAYLFFPGMDGITFIAAPPATS
jgi:deferrochelatase/peroxidase EfeB